MQINKVPSASFCGKSPPQTFHGPSSTAVWRYLLLAGMSTSIHVCLSGKIKLSPKCSFNRNEKHGHFQGNHAYMTCSKDPFTWRRARVVWLVSLLLLLLRSSSLSCYVLLLPRLWFYVALRGFSACARLTCVHVNDRARSHLCVCVCFRVCAFVRLCFVCLRLCSCVCVHLRLQLYIYICVCMYVCMYIWSPPKCPNTIPFQHRTLLQLEFAF